MTSPSDGTGPLRFPPLEGAGAAELSELPLGTYQDGASAIDATDGCGDVHFVRSSVGRPFR